MSDKTQDYTNPLFVEQERDKIAHEVVRAFKPQLAVLESQSLYAHFLRDRGLYAGPYKDTPEDHMDKFQRVAENTGDQTGPRFNLTLDGSKSVFMPGMCKHAFNASAAELNAPIAGWTDDYKKSYQQAAKNLEQAAWSASEATLRKDLNGALTALYGREWTDYKPKSGMDDKRDFDQK
jgi:hypothetical protein